MTTLRRKLLAKGTRFLDLTIMGTTLFLSIYIYSPETVPSNLVAFLSFKIRVSNLLLLPVLLIGWTEIFKFFGLYTVRRLGARFKELFDILKAVTAGVLFLSALSFIFERGNISQPALLSFWTSCTIFTILGRTLARSLMVRLRTRGRNLRHVVIVGSGPRALELARKLLGRQELGYKLLGFIDDNFEISQGIKVPKAKRLCNLNKLPQFIEDNIVDEVYIALPIKSYYEEIHNIVGMCEELGVLCRVPSDWFDMRTAKTSAFDLDGTSVLTVFTGSKNQLHHLWIKRTLDVLISSILILLLTPLFSIVALLIRLTSKGPIFFHQERMGYNKRIFKIFKFRTMVENAESLQPDIEHMNEVDGPVFKIKNDPRVTKIGMWLRKTSIDESPQLYNVLLGDMSLVGPRPLPLRDVNGFDARWHKRRFSMRPGMTCLWQVLGRNSLSFEDWMKLDLEYIDSWSLKLDLKILFQTVPAVIRGVGAS